MNRLFLAFGTLLVSALLVPGDADARRFGGGGGGARVGGSGFRGGGFSGARMMRPPVRAGIGRSGRGFAGGAIGVRPGMGGYRAVGIGNPGGRYDGRYYGGRYPSYAGRYPYYGGRYPYYRGYGRYPSYGGYYGNYYNGWGWGAGLAAGSVIGAAAASTYPAYSTPVSSTVGGYCATTVRTCALSSSVPVGTGCSCRTQGGRARGTVVAGF